MISNKYLNLMLINLCLGGCTIDMRDMHEDDERGGSGGAEAAEWLVGRQAEGGAAGAAGGAAECDLTSDTDCGMCGNVCNEGSRCTYPGYICLVADNNNCGPQHQVCDVARGYVCSTIDGQMLCLRD